MKRDHDLTGLMRFLARAEWAEPFENVIVEHFTMALETFDLEYEEIPDLLGEDWAATLWGCAFEDFLTRCVGSEARNVVEDYLKRRGWKESTRTRSYMTALRSSFMSLYEVSDIVEGESFRARDLVLGGEPVLVRETSATRSLKPWDRIGARLVDPGGRIGIAGGLLAFSLEASNALLRGLNGGGLEGDEAELMPSADETVLRRAAPLFTTAWLLDVLPKALGEMPMLLNSDGEEPVFHEFRYPLAKGVRQMDIADRLESTPALERVRAKVWTGSRSPGRSRQVTTGRPEWGPRRSVRTDASFWGTSRWKVASCF